MTTRRKSLAVAAITIGGLLLAGCGTAGEEEATTPSSTSDGGAGGETTEAAPEEGFADTITVGIEQTPDSYNANSADSNSVYNSYVDNITQASFIKVHPDGTIQPNTAYGTYEKTSDDPLTVHYTFADDAVWSDGTPIDFDDALLAWAAYSGTHPSGETDDSGNPLDLFNAASTNGWALVAMPEGKAGDKSFDMVFSEPYVDWEALASGFLPAHIAAEQAGLSTDDNGAELVAAIQGNDTEKLKAVADFWNAGWAYEADLPTLPDLALLPASGPYKYDNASNGTLTVVRNDKWWGEPAKTERIVFKTIAAEEMVQALQNGEIDQFDPSNATKDMLDSLTALGADVAKVETGESLTFSHIDLDSSPEGAFADPLVRQAFAYCVPRQELVEKFATPVFPDAQILDLHEVLPAQAGYDDVLSQVPEATQYDTVDLAKSASLLTEAGVTTPYPIVFTFSEQSQLRADQVALVKASCDQAGFDIQAKPDPDVFTSLSEAPGTWDAAVFGWAGSGLIASGQSIYVTGGNQNYGRYSDPDVDAAWDKIVVAADRAAAEPLHVELETALWSNLYNLTLYANPGMTAYSAKVSGVVYNPTQYGATWNAETWTKSL